MVREGHSRNLILGSWRIIRYLTTQKNVSATHESFFARWQLTFLTKEQILLWASTFHSFLELIGKKPCSFLAWNALSVDHLGTDTQKNLRWVFWRENIASDNFYLKRKLTWTPLGNCQFRKQRQKMSEAKMDLKWSILISMSTFLCPIINFSPCCTAKF